MRVSRILNHGDWEDMDLGCRLFDTKEVDINQKRATFL